MRVRDILRPNRPGFALLFPLLVACGGTSSPVESAPADAAAEAMRDGPIDGLATDVRDAMDAGEDATVDAPSDTGLDATQDSAAVVDPPTVLGESSRFGLGVASGDVTENAAILWTRYDGKATLRLEVWRMDGTVYAERVADLLVEPKSGGFIHADVTGLRPGTQYRYTFVEMTGETRATRSRIGHFRTAIADDAMEPLVIGASSCSKNKMDFGTLVRAGERNDLDAFLLLGDIIYSDEVSGEDDAVTLADYRGRYAQNFSTEGYLSLRSKTSLYATWDDHEVRNNFDPETIDPSLILTGRTAFFENIPMRHDPTDYDRIWRKYRWGKTAEFFILDTRSERKPSTRKDANAQYISRAQMDWLKAGLAGSQAYFRVILNTVPITDFPLVFDPAAPDRWEGYDAAREEILKYIEDQKIPGVAWISGDFHMGSIGYLSKSGLGSKGMEFLVGPIGQRGNVLAGVLGEPQFEWASSKDSYSVMFLDPQKKTFRIVYYDADGNPLVDKTYNL